MKNRNKREKGKGFLILIAAGLIFYSLYQMYDVYGPYLDGDRKYDALQELAREPEEEQAEKEQETQSQKIGSIGNESAIQFLLLKEINEDIVAWIMFVKPSAIDYPVVQGRDNQEYLTRTFDADGHRYGTIFMDVDNSSDFSDQNTFLYGHHMRNGSMFAGLLDYLDKAYYDAHPYFTIDTVDGCRLTYQVCSVEITTEDTLSYQWQYETKESFEEYCSYIMNQAEYHTDVVLSEESRLVSLSTCLNITTNQRVLLHGVLIKRV